MREMGEMGKMREMGEMGKMMEKTVNRADPIPYWTVMSLEFFSYNKE